MRASPLPKFGTGGVAGALVASEASGTTFTTSSFAAVAASVMVLGTLLILKFTLVNLRASSVALNEAPVLADLVVAETDLVVLWLVAAMDGATALRVRTVARPRLTAVVLNTTDFLFMVVTFLSLGPRLRSRQLRGYLPNPGNNVRHRMLEGYC